MKKTHHQNTKELPQLFLDRLKIIVGPSFFSDVQKTFIARATTFRINRLKKLKEIEEIKELLINQGFQLKQVAWYKDAFVLLNKSKRELTELDIYKEGKIYVQSLASMVPPLVLDPKPGEKVLDLTAAPGSKTSQRAAMMERTGELVANDMDKVRFFKLQHNMELLGATLSPPCEGGGRGWLSRETTPASPPSGGSASSPSKGVDSVTIPWQFTLRMESGWKLCSEYPEYFDKILLDAPCSAEARFVDGDPRSYSYWSERKIKEMVATQWRLLLAAWYALAPGGTLVYSTCTFAPEENEYQVSKFFEKVGNAAIEKVEIEGLKRLPIVKEWKGKPVNPETKKCLRVYPTKEIEGFFVAKMQKVET